MTEMSRRLGPGRVFLNLWIVLSVGAAVALIPSSAYAQTCSAGGALNPLPNAGFTCAMGLQAGDIFEIVYRITNSSVTVPGGLPVAAELTGQVTATLACEDSVCAIEIPGTLSFVSSGANGCFASVAGVTGCALNPMASNEVLVTTGAVLGIPGGGVMLPAGGSVDFVTLQVRADTAVPGPACGFFTFAQTEMAGIVIDDESCPLGITGAADGSSSIFFPEPVPTMPTIALLLLLVLLGTLGVRAVRRTASA